MADSITERMAEHIKEGEQLLESLTGIHFDSTLVTAVATQAQAHFAAAVALQAGSQQLETYKHTMSFDHIAAVRNILRDA